MTGTEAKTRTRAVMEHYQIQAPATAQQAAAFTVPLENSFLADEKTAGAQSNGNGPNGSMVPPVSTPAATQPGGQSVSGIIPTLQNIVCFVEVRWCK